MENQEVAQSTQADAPVAPDNVTADSMTTEQLKAQIDALTAEPETKLVYPNGQPGEPPAPTQKETEADTKAEEQKTDLKPEEKAEEKEEEKVDYQKRYQESSREAHRLVEENRKLQEKLNLFLEDKLTANTKDKDSGQKQLSPQEVKQLKEEWNDRFREDPAAAMAEFMDFYVKNLRTDVLTEVEKKEKVRLEETTRTLSAKAEIDKLVSDYPDLNNAESPLYKKANEHYGRLVQKHPNMAKSPELFRLASEYAMFDLKTVKAHEEAKTKGKQQARMEVLSEIESGRTASTPEARGKVTQQDIDKMSAEEFARFANLPTAM